jgi:hypothetical protein
LKLPFKCFSPFSVFLFFSTVPLLGFIFSFLIYLDDYTDYNYKFNVYAYFTKLPYNIGFIFLIIYTIWLIIDFIKRKIRIATISIAKKYIVTDSDGSRYLLMDINGNEYAICDKVHDFLEGNEVIEVKIENDYYIFQVFNIIKQGERRNT